MIDRVMAFKSSDGQLWAKLDEMQIHEMALLLSGLSAEPATETGGERGLPGAVDRFDKAKAQARDILRLKDRIIDVLTMSPKSKPKARAINGGTKTRPSRAGTTRPVRPVTPETNNATTQPA